MINQSIEWETYEFPYHEKSGDWYWILGIAVVVGAIIAFILNNILFGIFILLAGVVLGIYASKKPDIIKGKVSRSGVQIEDKLYPFSSIDTFWIDDHEYNPKLLMTLKQTLSMHVAIPLGDADTESLRDYMLEYVDEEQQHEGFTEKVMDLLHI